MLHRAVSNFNYDLAVVELGPAGHYAAVQRAKLRARVIMIESKPILGGIYAMSERFPALVFLTNRNILALLTSS